MAAGIKRGRTRKGHVKYTGVSDGFVVTMYPRKHDKGIVANIRRRKVGEPLSYVHPRGKHRAHRRRRRK